MSGDWSEFDNFFSKHCFSSGIAIEGRVPGAGKTHSVLSYIERYEIKAVIICPFNALCSD